MITYNHEKFIAQAIESVLMQEAAFPVELVIGEDCSTDKTRDIVRSYAQGQPDLIRPLLPACNIGMLRNFHATLRACRGEYIAFLEGDDYWTSPQKLQRQTEFLDRHPDFSICGHRVAHIFHEEPERTSCLSPAQKETGTLEDILRWNYLPSPSVVYRAALGAELPAWFTDLPQGDWPLWVLLAQRGRIGFLNEVMAHYRVHGGGNWMGASADKKMVALETGINAIHKGLNNRYPRLRREALFTAHLYGARLYNEQRHFLKAWRRLWLGFKQRPAFFWASSQVHKCVHAQLRFYVLDPLARATASVRRNYYRARIWAGAKRRRLWSRIVQPGPKEKGSEASK